MCSSRSILLFASFCLLFSSVAWAQPGVAPNTPNIMGIYSSPVCDAEFIDNVTPWAQVTAYLVVTHPYNTSLETPVTLVDGFECSIQYSSGLFDLGISFPTDAVNVGSGNGEYIVGFYYPVPVSDDACVVGELTILYANDVGGVEETLSLSPANYPSIPGFMAILDASDSGIFPLEPSSGDWADPVFGINTGPLWSGTTSPGEVIVDPEPDLINAPWTLHGSEGFHQTGIGDQTFLDMDPDFYVLTWGEVHAWSTPAENPVGLNLEHGGSITFQAEYTPKPEIISVSDIPNDQGRQVRLIWYRCFFDRPGFSPTITEYGIYRRQDGIDLDSRDKLEGWDFVGTAPARGDSIYQFVAPTLCDSTIVGGQCLSTFMVSAMTASPLEFFDSDPLSGYSVDNLHPVSPAGFRVAFAHDGNELSWDYPTDPDVDHYLVYRNISLEYPGEEPIAQVMGTTWFDGIDDGSAWDYHYWVVAVDHAGNRSHPTDWENTQVSGVGNNILPKEVALFSAAPNPFNPMTTIKFELPEEQRVRLSIFGIDGKLINTLENGVKSAGSHYTVWKGLDSAGRKVSSGTYVYRLEAGDIQLNQTMTLIK